LANTAFQHTDTPAMQAESCYLLARAYHAQGKFGDAKRYYSTAVSLVEDYAPAHHGLAQLELRQNRIKPALVHFEKVMAHFPLHLDTIKAVGSLHLASGRRERALQVLTTATEEDPTDPETWIELGETLEGGDPLEALRAYTSAMKLLRRNERKHGGQAPSPALSNNVAVLQQAQGDRAGALELLTQAVAAAGIDIEGDNFVIPGEEGAAIVFNLAQLKEEMLMTDQAKCLFEKVLKVHPTFVDCHLRAASAARARGDMAGAMAAATLALEGAAGNSDALAVVGSLHMTAANWPEAQNAFKALQGKGPGAVADVTEEMRNDPYAMLAIANIIYYNALKDGSRVHTDEAVKRKMMDRLTDALTLYQKVLHLHSNNIYAANGVGVCLAEQGKIAAAKDVFTAVQEVAAGSTERCLPDVWVNLAHIYLALAQYNSAIKMYQGCLRKFYYNCDAQVMLYIARAYYDWDKLLECKRTLLRALHLNPTDRRLRFNIALAMQEFAYRTLQRQTSSATKRYADVVTAVEELRLALKFFAALQGMPVSTDPNVVPMIGAAKLQTHVQFCADTLEKAQNVLDAARREEEAAAARREEQRQRLKAESALKTAEEARKAEEGRQAMAEAQQQVRIIRSYNVVQSMAEAQQQVRIIKSSVCCAVHDGGTAAGENHKELRMFVQFLILGGGPQGGGGEAGHCGGTAAGENY
jgi:RNA polymerase-associated protein CTR9